MGNEDQGDPLDDLHGLLEPINKPPMKMQRPPKPPGSSPYSATMKLHMMRRHSADKPYKCGKCWKGFAQKGYLKTHMLFHDYKRDFACEHCGRAYYLKCDLKTHISVKHAAVKPCFECTVCHKTFTQKTSQWRHMRNVHKDLKS